MGYKYFVVPFFHLGSLPLSIQENPSFVVKLDGFCLNRYVMIKYWAFVLWSLLEISFSCHISLFLCKLSITLELTFYFQVKMTEMEGQGHPHAHEGRCWIFLVIKVPEGQGHLYLLSLNVLDIGPGLLQLFTMCLEMSLAHSLLLGW